MRVSINLKRQDVCCKIDKVVLRGRALPRLPYGFKLHLAAPLDNNARSRWRENLNLETAGLQIINFCVAPPMLDELSVMFTSGLPIELHACLTK